MSRIYTERTPIDWRAYTDDYDGAPDAGPQMVGIGDTEAEALADLNEQLSETP